MAPTGKYGTFRKADPKYVRHLIHAEKLVVQVNGAIGLGGSLTKNGHDSCEVEELLQKRRAS